MSTIHEEYENDIDQHSSSGSSEHINDFSQSTEQIFNNKKTRNNPIFEETGVNNNLSKEEVSNLENVLIYMCFL